MKIGDRVVAKSGNPHLWWDGLQGKIISISGVGNYSYVEIRVDSGETFTFYRGQLKKMTMTPLELAIQDYVNKELTCSR